MEDESLKWISVKDKLPEPMVDILACCISMGGQNTAFEKHKPYHCIECLTPFGFRTDSFFAAKVTHWMPLPKLPED